MSVVFLICAAGDVAAESAAVDGDGATSAGGSALVEEARAAYGRGELDVALRDFQAALEQGGLVPQELTTVHLNLGVLRGAMGDLEAAERSFEAALALNPMLATPSEAGGALQRIFDGLREARDGRALSLSLSRSGTANDSDQGELITVQPTNAPPGVIDSIRLQARDASGEIRWSETLAPQGSQGVMVPRAAWGEASLLTVTAVLLDQYDNQLTRAELALAREVEGAEESIAGQDESTGVERDDERETGDAEQDRQPARVRRPWYRNPVVWIVLGCFVTSGVTVGVVLGTAEREFEIGAPRVR